MSEEEWLCESSPFRMLPSRWARENLWASFSRRKVVLFACACCRRNWDQLDERWRRLIATCERSAGQANYDQIIASASDDVPDFFRARTAPGGYAHRAVAAACSRWLSAGSLENVLMAASEAERRERTRRRVPPDEGPDPSAVQAHLIRCVFGNPFRPVSFAPAWNNADVRGLAQTIHDEYAFEQLPILADALEDAGCSEGAILDHCRHDRFHGRGCWIVDGVLGGESLGGDVLNLERTPSE